MFGTLFDDAFLPSFLICFIFLFFFFLNPRPFVQSFFDSRYVCAPAALRNICSVYFYFFGEVYCFIFIWVVRCAFSFRLLLVYSVPIGWISTSAYVIIQSIKQECHRECVLLR